MSCLGPWQEGQGQEALCHWDKLVPGLLGREERAGGGRGELYDRPPPLLLGRRAVPGGLHSRQAARLAVRVTPLSAPLEHHRHLSWALGPESRSPRTSARTSQTLDRAQRPEKDRRSGLGGVHSESPFYCLQALFYKSTLRTSPPAHHSHKVSPQTLDPSPPRHSLLVPHLDYEGILAGSELSLPLATQGRGLQRTPHGFLG